jgi:hypothetical protein
MLPLSLMVKAVCISETSAASSTATGATT